MTTRTWGFGFLKLQEVPHVVLMPGSTSGLHVVYMDPYSLTQWCTRHAWMVPVHRALHNAAWRLRNAYYTPFVWLLNAGVMEVPELVDLGPGLIHPWRLLFDTFSLDPATRRARRIQEGFRV
jgi:hypothetical protein